MLSSNPSFFLLPKVLTLALLLFFLPSMAQASNYPFNENVNMKVGIGTTMITNAYLSDQYRGPVSGNKNFLDRLGR